MKHLRASVVAFFVGFVAQASDLHVGPTCSLFEVRPGAYNPVELTPGLGVQGWLDFGKWSVDLALYGSALGLGTANPGAGVSIAPFACYSPWGICLGPGGDLFGTSGGVFSNWTWKKNFFIVFSMKSPVWELLHFSTVDTQKQ